MQNWGRTTAQSLGPQFLDLPCLPQSHKNGWLLQEKVILFS